MQKEERERDLQGEEEERDANKWLWKKKISLGDESKR